MTRAILGFAVLCGAVWLSVFAWARTPYAPPLSDDERAAVMSQLRGALEARRAPPSGRLERPLGDLIVVTGYDAGRRVLRVQAGGASLQEAVDRAAEAIGRDRPSAEVRARLRLKVDVVLARAPVLSSIPLVFALSIVPGMDGLGLSIEKGETLLTPDDLLQEGLLTGLRPLPALDLELGLDTRRALLLLGSRAGLSAEGWRAAHKRIFRFRTDGFVEPAAHDGAPLPVLRGQVPGAQLTRSSLRRAAEEGGRYLLRHLDSEGMYDYEYHTVADMVRRDGYALPRHAGTTYFLAQLHGATRDPAVREGARRALAWLRSRSLGGCDQPERACVIMGAGQVADLGSAALSLLAASEYERVTGDREFAPWADRLAAFLVEMQKPDGDFCHLYDPVARSRDEHTRLLYYSGEATFALARRAALGGAAASRWGGAADRGLAYLTGPAYDYLAGQFFFGEDHWTCLAADAAWESLPVEHRLRYSRFCDAFAAFLRRMQFAPGESMVAAQPDLAGSYGFSPLILPYPVPVGSRSEAAISVHAMDLRRGQDGRASAEATREQVLRGMRFLLAHQITDDGSYLMANPEAARGGFLMNDASRVVRIDFVQHSCSAMLRAAELL